MLPNFLRSSYKEYKANSDAVANWLAQTARDRGYSLTELVDDAEPVQKVPKLKGRARKLAREAAAAAQSENGSQQRSYQQGEKSHPKYFIPISGFVKLAEFIANAKPKIKVPRTFHSALRKAIDGRKRHRAYHSGADPGSPSDSTDGHGYFISVLHNVWKTLEPLFEEVSKARPEIESAKRKDSINTAYEKLTLEEPLDEGPTDTSNSMRIETTTTESIEFGVKQDARSEVEETFFAFQCMLHDFGNLRRYLRQVWSGYRDGVFDLTAVSVVSNTAIDFARGIEGEFITSFRQGDVERFINMSYVYCCVEVGVSPHQKEYASDDMNFAAYEGAERILFPIYSLLSGFNGVLEPNHLPAMKPGFYGIYDPASNRTTKTNREKFLEDKMILLEALPEFTAIAMSSDRIWAEDEITRGMRELVKTKQIRLWLALACQVFLDIHHILRKEVVRGLDYLRRSATNVKIGINSVLEFHKDLRADTWPKSNDKFLMEITDYIKDWVETDMIETLRSRMLKRSSTQPPRPSSYFLLKQHPLLCGLMTFSIRLRSQEIGIAFANAWGSVMYSAHLYNAVRQEKLLDSVWDDMNLALLSHDTQAIFIGGFPATIEDYFKRWALAMGVSTSYFAKDNRPNKGGKLKESKNGPRSLNELCAVSRMFRQRYCEQSGLLSLLPDDVQRILEEHADEEDPADYVEDEAGWATPRIVIHKKAPEHNEHSGKKNMKSPLKGGLRPIDLLNSLLNSLVSEALELSINHFRIHTFSWRMLQSVHLAVAEDLKDIYGPGYLEEESQLPHMVGMILMAAMETQKIGKLLRAKKKNVVTNELLIKAGNVMKIMIDSGAGSIECKMLEDGLGYVLDMPDVLNVSEVTS